MTRRRTSRRATGLAPVAALLISTVVPLSAGICAPACESLTGTQEPFELQLRSQDGSTSPEQVYRSGDLVRTEVKRIAGRESKALYQANFVLVTPLPDGSPLASLYDVPTSRYIWDQDARQVHTWSDAHGKASGRAEQSYEIRDDVELQVGDCAFKSKHYVVTTKTPSLEVVYEGWLAPALNATLKYRLSAKSAAGKTTETSATAVAIRPLPPGTKAP